MHYGFTNVARRFTVVSCALTTAALAATICTTSVAWADTTLPADTQTTPQISESIQYTEGGENMDAQAATSSFAKTYGEINASTTSENADTALATLAQTHNVTVGGTLCYSSAQELLAHVNAARAAAGVGTLTWDSNLERTAIQRAAETSQYWSHVRPNGQECFTAFPANVGSMGENIAVGQTTSATVNSDWTNSPGHYANMVNAKFNSMAAACFIAENGLHYWVEVFAGAAGDGVYIAQGSCWADLTVETQSENYAFEQAAGKTYSVNIGRSVDLDITPDSTSNMSSTNMQFKSSNTGVATVSQTGVVTGVSAGTTTISVTDKKTGTQLFQAKVTVNANYLFDDVPSNAWYANSSILGYVVSNGLLTGYSDSTFAPYDSLTRGQVATILWRMAGSPSASGAKFADVDYSKYYASAITWARTSGVISGYTSSTGAKLFKPDQPVTRQEFCVMLYNYAKKVAGANVSAQARNAKAFTDSASVASWSSDAVNWALANGIISGEQNGNKVSIDPNGATQRCAAAKMIAALEQNVLK
jgi:uncharacterized protein YkwD